MASEGFIATHTSTQHDRLVIYLTKDQTHNRSEVTICCSSQPEHGRRLYALAP